MAPKISIPEDLYARLEALAQPFVDTEPADVIRRLLDACPTTPKGGAQQLSGPIVRERHVSTRNPRERGAKVELDGQVIAVDSVRDLYEQVLRQITRNGGLERLKLLLPIKTSSKRYLIAEKPVHPNGNHFVVPVEHRGVYMEAHKGYQTALTQLSYFLSKCGHTLRYLG